ncbi:MAG TPA: ROK family protein, partial [Spirochaetia bacterium]
MGLAAGIDFGGTSAKMGLVQEDGRILCKTSVPLERNLLFEQVVEKVSDGLRGLLGGVREPLTTIGIGTPGFIDKHEGRVIGGSENIPSMQDRSMQKELQRIFGVPAFAENDATAAAAG